MKKPAVTVPDLVRHKSSDRACARIHGRDIWLGKWGAPEAEERYRRIVGEAARKSKIATLKSGQQNKDYRV